MCVIAVAKVAIMLRNGRTHLNIQVNVNSIITIFDIQYNTTLIVPMLIKSIHMTLQNILILLLLFSSNSIESTNCPVKHLKQKLATSLLLKLDFFRPRLLQMSIDILEILKSKKNISCSFLI